MKDTALGCVRWRYEDPASGSEVSHGEESINVVTLSPTRPEVRGTQAWMYAALSTVTPFATLAFALVRNPRYSFKNLGRC